LKLNQKGPYSRFFIYVWAYEQGELSAMGSASTSTSTPVEGAGAVDETGPERSTCDVQGADEKVQDVLVPWVLKGPTSTQTKPKPKTKSKSKTRKQKSTATIEAEEVELPTPEPEPEAGGEGEGDKVYHRYYHLFVQGELRDLVLNAGKEEGYRILEDDAAESKPGLDLANLSIDGGKWLRIRGQGWEADNWWLEAEVGVGPYIPDHKHEHEHER
jgi:tRNA (uracil-5-)-methyltransferase TRM9